MYIVQYKGSFTYIKLSQVLTFYVSFSKRINSNISRTVKDREMNFFCWKEHTFLYLMIYGSIVALIFLWFLKYTFFFGKINTKPVYFENYKKSLLRPIYHQIEKSVLFPTKKSSSFYLLPFSRYSSLSASILLKLALSLYLNINFYRGRTVYIYQCTGR